MHFFSALRFGFKVYQISGWVAVAVHQILTKSTPEWRTLDLDLIPIFFGFVQNALCFLHQRDLLHSGLTSRKDKWTILFSSSTNLQRLWNTVFHFNDLIVINCIKLNDLIVINGKRINGHADSAALGEEEKRIVHLSSLLVNPLCSRKRGAFWPKPTFDAMQAPMQPSLKFKATFLRPSQVSQLTEGRGTWLDQTSLLQRAL